MTVSFPRVSQFIIAGQRVCAKKMAAKLQDRPGFEGWVSPAGAQERCPSGTVMCDIENGLDNSFVTCLKEPDGVVADNTWKQTNCPIMNVLIKKVAKNSGCSGNQRSGFTCVEFGDEREAIGHS